MRGPLIAAGHGSMADWASSGSACIPHAERETRKLLSTCRFHRRTLPTVTTTTWRDIADHLTPEQVGELERWEALGDEPSTLFAREYASENKTRVFVSAERHIGGVRLRVCGRQQPDGAIERWVELSARDVRLSDEQIHELCAALLDSRR